MKGIPTLRLSQLKRTAALAGVGALVVAGAALGSATHAYALDTVLGNAPGALTLVDTTTGNQGTAIVNASTSDVLSYKTTEACPAAEAGSATLFAVSPTDPTGQNQAQLAPAFGSVAAAWSQNLSAAANTVTKIASAFATGAMNGTVTEFVVQCVSADQSTSAYVMDEFVSVSADGSTFSVSNTAPAVAATPTVTLTASPNDYAGQPVTITATVAATSNGTPQGTVEFTQGSTSLDGGVPVGLTNGVASVQTTFQATGQYPVTATYTSSNTGSWNSGEVGTITVTVTMAPTNAIPLTVTVPTTGTLVLTVGTTAVAFGTPTVTSTGLATTGTIPNGQVQVTDTRNNYPGWAVTGQDSAWTSSGGGTFPGSQLGWAPTSGTTAQAVAFGPTVSAGTTPGLSAASVLASAPHGLGNYATSGVGNGYGVTNLGANLSLLIPLTAPPGAYASTLTFTAIPSD
jgi:Bacterial Ig-like domain (group 3)